ncbi:tRNA (adenosine(37)-N6)-threonylcarbamoyltransferase complex dimerization subunit type 1 TsaB [Paucihalobacter ruber]|uniref:tRNA (Adenosine(37)-N6)-threonylcarbamoyltransferase complex dimerization subunit type 1 TsaB n=1 Tax=Paucihalobacter ruber TaxID=2567861 RepID=A0A506PUD0_9FLAO|nr:tRNA (adenosine(37)-N6)-threonylcarbamoyltransferase complex dimerization subunit type 1 TsaB [Paucihalobacter ruber]TPV35830.1 tRNA (adenosine(37)-N6)-threonylcarbamoyltransferase complex dimerization subunit type 1 TsaB [Paucihalobacter ruber]
MTYILLIETSTTNCSVALSKNDKVIALKEYNDSNYSHSELLHNYILEVITEAQIQLEDLSAVAISKGPGSYTGLRIGVSAAKGLCYALNIPLISINTLESLAHQTTIKDGFIVPVLDARRMEVYSAVFNQKYQMVEGVKAQVITPDSFNSLLSENTAYFLGSGANKIATVVNHQNAHFILDQLPSAKQMAKLAYQKYKIGNTEDVAYFEPFYLKDFMVTKPKA